jgi:hypothetical protein
VAISDYGTAAQPLSAPSLSAWAASVASALGYEMRGSGIPEGAVTAPVGTYYTDLAGTRGAWRWIKKSGAGNTGWAVIHGDTGQRDVASLLDPAHWSATAGVLTLRREGNRVTVNSSPSAPGVIAVSGTTPNVFYPPVGFRAVTTAMGVVRVASNGTVGTVEAVNYGTFEVRIRIPGTVTAGGGYQFSLTYLTNDAWPATLPGV